ncbi:MAG: hypothetical protein OEW59_08785, partial [Gammaproteobacteria bacterium]|nr:hypothetical protein [Gammaproteobacteria bacterium]
MFWLITGVMLAIAVLFVAAPLYRCEKRLSSTAIASIVLVAAVTAVLYAEIGSPTVPSGRGTVETGGMPDVEQMVASLAERLRDTPDDVAGWKMLG